MNLQASPTRITQVRWLAGLLVTVVLLVYMASRSASLDDFDSYSFVLALDQFDIALQQPQPPGFPVYVAVGRLLNNLLVEPRVALTTLSAIGGALAVAALGWLTHKLYQRAEITLGVMAIFAFLPIQWLTSAKALSDAPGLALALGSLAVMSTARQDRRWLLPGAALLGLSLGMRPQVNLPGLLLLAWIGWDLFRVRAWWRLVITGMVFGVAIALWLVPTLTSTGGIESYRALLDAHSDHVWRSDSLFNAEVTVAALTARVKDFIETLVVPTLGISVYEPLSLLDNVQLGILTVLIAGGLVLPDYRQKENRAVLVWLVLALVPYFLLTSLNRPRLMLPCLPPLVLLMVAGWGRIIPYVVARYALWSGIALVMVAQGSPLASTLATEPAPPAQAAAFIRERYPAEQTLIAAAGSYRAAQVELDEYALVYRYRFDAEAAQNAVQSGHYRAIAILDREDFGDVIEILDGDGLYVPVADRLFSRDERVHWQHSKVRLQILLPASSVDAEMLRLPPDGRINIATEEWARFLGQGWFRPETPGGVMARWAGDGLTSTLRVALDSGTTYRVTLLTAAFPANQTVTVRVNGHHASVFGLVKDWQEYTFVITPEMTTNQPISTITLEHRLSGSPFERTDGSSSDRRALTAAYAWVQFEPE